MDIFEYVKNERRKFSRKAFSILDSIVLSKLAYLKFENVIPEEGIILKDTFKAEYYDDMLENLPHKEEFTKLYTFAVLSPRFRDIRLKYYSADNDPEAIKQFAAITFILGDKIYIAFRGTDTSVVGWKENFHMTFEYPIESQKQAVKYLTDVFNKENKKMLVGGHSKGGNLAVFAAINAKSEIQKDILKVYSFDGPGFPNEVYSSVEYKAIRNKITKIVPKESLIGLLFEKDKFLICKSNEKGALQHEPMFWRVNEGDLVYLKSLAKSSVNFNNIMMKWMETATIEERELFVDTLFSLIKEENVPNLYSKLVLIQNTPGFIRGYNKLDSDRKEFMSGTFKNLINIIVGKEEKEKEKDKDIKENKNKDNKDSKI